MPKKAMTCPECTCRWPAFAWMIASAITMAVGLYVFIMALQSQWNGGSDFLTIGLQYALGFIIFAFGKMCTWKSKACCPAHSKA